MATATSSGYGLGSSCWTVQYDGLKVVYLGNIGLDDRFPRPCDWQALAQPTFCIAGGQQLCAMRCVCGASWSTWCSHRFCNVQTLEHTVA